MCTGAEAAAYAAAVLAAGYGANQQAEAQNEAQQRQADALNAALAGQDEFNKMAERKAMENAQEYDMTDRTKRFEETRKEAGDSLVGSLVQSREQSVPIEQASGRVSDSFTSDRATKMADQFQKSVDMARLMGNMRGQQDMLGNEAIMNADYASQLNTIGRNARGTYDAAQPGILNAGKVDTGKVTTGAIAQSIGTAYLMNGLGSAFGGGSTAGADVGNGVGNANLTASGSTGLKATSGAQGLSGGSVSTSGLMNSGNSGMFKLGGYYG